MYALVGALAAGSLALLARWMRAPAGRLGAGFVGTALALAASHYYAVFFLGAEVLVLLVIWRRPLRAWLPAATATAGIAAMGLLAAMLVASHKAGGSYALGLLAVPGALWGLVAGYAVLPDSAALHAEGARAALGLLPFAAVGVVPAAACALAALPALDRPARLALFVPGLVVLAVPFVVHLVLGVAVNPRYFMAAAPALLVLLAAGAARWRAPRSPWWSPSAWAFTSPSPVTDVRIRAARAPGSTPTCPGTRRSSSPRARWRCSPSTSGRGGGYGSTRRPVWSRRPRMPPRSPRQCRCRGRVG